MSTEGFVFLVSGTASCSVWDRGHKRGRKGGREQEEAESRKKKEYQYVRDRNPKQESESSGMQPVAQQGIQ